MKWTLLFLFLLALSLEDLKKKEVSAFLLAVFLAFGLAYQVLTGTWMEVPAALVPGVLMLLAGKMTKWAAGPADGMTVGILGFYLTIWEVTNIVWIALMVAAGASLYLALVKKKSKAYRIPFLPFLLAGAVFYRILKGVLLMKGVTP